MSNSTTEPTASQSPPRRRGKTLRVAKLVITFADGSTETWEFPWKTPGFYRRGGNRQTRPEQSWVTHTLWWNSDKKVEG